MQISACEAGLRPIGEPCPKLAFLTLPAVCGPSIVGLDINFDELDLDNLSPIEEAAFDNDTSPRTVLDRSLVITTEHDWFLTKQSWALSHLPPGQQ